MYREITGDIFNIIRNSEVDKYHLFMHGCNCFCQQGAGVALGVKEQFPAAYEADCTTIKGDRSKMGRVSHAVCQVGGYSIVAANAYTQYRYGKGGPHLEYGALRSCISRAHLLLKDLVFHKGERYHFIMPKIGTGLAGGDWTDVKKIIQECVQFENIDVTVVIYDK